MTPQECIIERSFNWSSSLYIITQPSLVAIALRWWIYKAFSLSHDLERPRNQRVMWLYQWEPLMVRHYSAKFGGHRHWSSGDIMYLVVEKQNSTCSLNSVITILSKGHGMSCVHLRIFTIKIALKTFSSVSSEIIPILVARVLSNDWRNIYSKINFFQFIQKPWQERKREKWNIKKSYCKAFCVTHKRNNQNSHTERIQWNIIKRRRNNNVMIYLIT